ncbi:MAG TPA: hypothetical protein VL128_15065 [Candidatus Eisenbacteria bacterium]|nr:hypothetical protein [Candidatus Eisenbacteria bacterium]
MRTLRGVLALSLSFALFGLAAPVQAGGKALGLLTLAYSARLNTSEAFAGLSIFPGEEMATDSDGKAIVRIGASVASLAGDSCMTLEPIAEGAHVDLLAGSVFVSSTPQNPLEVHAEDALVRPRGAQEAQATIVMFAPKVLQVTARLGSLDFSYHGESRVLPEGQTYRIYLDAEADSDTQGPAGAGSGRTTVPASRAGVSTAAKVTYFIVAGAGAGFAAWGIRDVIQSNDSVESPAKP